MPNRLNTSGIGTVLDSNFSRVKKEVKPEAETIRDGTVFIKTNRVIQGHDSGPSPVHVSNRVGFRLSADAVASTRLQMVSCQHSPLVSRGDTIRLPLVCPIPHSCQTAIRGHFHSCPLNRVARVSAAFVGGLL